jgi:hypothetical protein
MLDVHPPHSPTHTWKDFFIHIATITVGLLIAVGLEQGVEAVHHRRQLAELREALAKDNEKALRNDIELERYARTRTVWLEARMDDAAKALQTAGHPHDLGQPQQATYQSVPVDPAWRAAKSSNLIEVMPQEEIKAYSELDDVLEAVKKYDDETQSSTLMLALERQFRVLGSDGRLDFSQSTRADGIAYLGVLSERLQHYRLLYDATRYARGALQAVLRGERDLDRIDDEEIKVEEGAVLGEGK